MSSSKSEKQKRTKGGVTLCQTCKYRQYDREQSPCFKCFEDLDGWPAWTPA